MSEPKSPEQQFADDLARCGDFQREFREELKVAHADGYIATRLPHALAVVDEALASGDPFKLRRAASDPDVLQLSFLIWWPKHRQQHLDGRNTDYAKQIVSPAMLAEIAKLENGK